MAQCTAEEMRNVAIPTCRKARSYLARGVDAPLVAPHQVRCSETPKHTTPSLKVLNRRPQRWVEQCLGMIVCMGMICNEADLCDAVLAKALAYTLTCIDANGVMHVMQISKINNALYPFMSYLPAPGAEQGHCKPSSYDRT